MRIFLFLFFSGSLFFSCQSPKVIKKDKLPILGNRDFVDGDTVFHTVPAFSLLNQDSQVVTNANFEGELYVVDFFFTSCPTICPKVKKQMLRLYEKYQNESKVSLVSFTIDPKRDDVSKLKTYSSNLEVKAPKWNFLTGDKWEIHGLAPGFFSVAHDDPDAPGGFDHSGLLILVDKNGYVRSFCQGTEAESVDGFLDDIDLLLRKEY